MLSVFQSIPKYITELIITDNHKLEKGMIHHNIKIIKFQVNFNQIIEPGFIPDTVEEIIFEGYNNTFNQKLEIGSIPFGVKKLDLKYTLFNQPLDIGVIPNSIETLLLPINYNLQIKEGVIPNSVKYLDTSSYNIVFNKGSIPNSVNELVCEFLPSDIKFHGNVLPDSINKLYLDTKSFPNLEKFINPNIKTLTLGHFCFEHPLKVGKIPNGIEELKIYDLNNSPSNNYKSSDFTLLEGCIPNTVRKLELLSYDNQLITRDQFPNNIESITFRECKNLKLSFYSFPNNVSELKFISCPNCTFEKRMFPENLKKLEINNINIELNENTLPENLLELRLFNYGNPKIEKSFIPDSIKYLNLGNNLLRNIDDSIFTKDRIVEINDNYNKTYNI